MSEGLLIWIIFFIIVIPSNFIFNYWYRKDENSSRIVSISVGFVIGVISMFIAIYLVGRL